MFGDSRNTLKEGPCSFKSTRNRDSRNLNVNCLLDFHVKHLYPPLWLQLDNAYSLFMNVTCVSYLQRRKCIYFLK